MLVYPARMVTASVILLRVPSALSALSNRRARLSLARLCRSARGVLTDTMTGWTRTSL